MEKEDFNIYSDFAYVYDSFMDNIPYQSWYDYLHGLLMDYNINNGIVVDLACGTGTITAMLAADGYDMIGIDLSYEMLNIARGKCPDNVLFLHQDIRELDLYGTASAMVCICDGINYMLDEESLYQVFDKVYTFLDDGGVFIFDMKTRHFYENMLGNQTIADNRENSSLIWENEFDKTTGINEYFITIYNLYSKELGLFERFEEFHRQRAYPVEKIKELAAKAGLETVAVYNAFTKEEPLDNSERIYYIMRKRRMA